MQARGYVRFRIGANGERWHGGGRERGVSIIIRWLPAHVGGPQAGVGATVAWHVVAPPLLSRACPLCYSGGRAV